MKLKKKSIKKKTSSKPGKLTKFYDIDHANKLTQ